MIRLLILTVGLCVSGLAYADSDVIQIAALFVLLLAGPAGWGMAVKVSAYIALMGATVYGADQAKKALERKQQEAKNAYNAGLKDRTVTRVATDAPYRTIYGAARVGSDIVALFTSGAKEEYRHLVCIHAAHECEAIDEMFVAGQRITALDANGDIPDIAHPFVAGAHVANTEVITGTILVLAYAPIAASLRITYTNYTNTYSGQVIWTPPLTVVGTTVTMLRADTYTCHYDYQTYTSMVRIRKHLGGASDPVDSVLNGLFPTEWNTNAVLRGFCYTVVRLNLNQTEFQGGPVPIEALIRGKKLYDIRTGVTAYSDSPPLAILDYLQSEMCGVDDGAVQDSGTALAATSTSLTLAASASVIADAYRSSTVIVTGGAGVSQSRNVVTSRKNQFTWSQKIGNWLGTAITPTSDVTLAPDGTMTGGKVAATVANTTHLTLLTGASPTIAIGDKITIKVSVKAAELSIVTIQGCGLGLQGYLPLFNASTGTLTGTYPPNTTFTGKGNGWYEIVIPFTISSVGSNLFASLYDAAGTTTIFAGNGTDGVYFWGSQFESDLVSTEYIRTEANAAVGIAVDIPWSSNAALNSNNFTTAPWVRDHCTIDNASILAPDGTFTASHIKSDAFTGRISLVQRVAVVANTKNTASIYLKAAEWDSAFLFIDQTTVAEGAYYGLVLLNLATGVSSNPAVVTLESAGDGWYRAALTATPTVADYWMTVAPLNPANGNVNAIVGDGVSGIYVWHGQLNSGSVATPYIATGASPVLPLDSTSTYTIRSRSDIPYAEYIAAANVCDPITGCTYTQNGTIIIVTKVGHDLSVGDVREMVFLTGAGVGGHYRVGEATTSTFTIYATANATTSGNCTIAGLYTINGTVTSDQDQRKTLESMAQCMAGSIVGNTWGINAGAYAGAVMTLNQSDIVGALSVLSGTPDADLYNSVKGQYVGADTQWVVTDIKPYQNNVYVASDTMEKWTSIEFPFTNSMQRCHNLARVFMEDQRNGFTIKAPFSLKTWSLRIGDRVLFTSAFLGQENKVFRVTDKKYSPDQAVELVLKEDAASIWDLADAVTVDSTPNTTLPSPFIVGLCSNVRMSEVLYETTGSVGVRSKVILAWDAPADVSVVDYGVEYKPYATGTWIELFNVRGKQYEFIDLAPGDYDFRVKARNILGVVSQYTEIKTFTVMGLTAAPANVTGFSVRPMAGLALAIWDRTVDLDVKIGGDVEIRYCPLSTGATWQQGVVLPDGQMNGDASSASVSLATGTYMAKFIDSTEHYSDTAASFVVTEALVTGWTTVATSTQETAFTGVHNGTVATGTVLTLSGATLFDSMAGLFDAAAGVFDGTGGIRTEGTYSFSATLDLATVASRRFHARIKSASLVIDTLFDSNSGLFDAATGLFDGADVNDTNCTVYASVSNDNITYSAWTSFMVADFNCRYAKFQALLTSGNTAHNIEVSELSVAVKV